MSQQNEDERRYYENLIKEAIGSRDKVIKSLERRVSALEDELRPQSDVMDTLSSNLQKVLKRRNMTYAELSRISGISETTISVIARGKHEPTASKLKSIAVSLGVSTDWLLGIKEA